METKILFDLPEALIAQHPIEKETTLECCCYTNNGDIIIIFMIVSITTENDVLVINELKLFLHV